MRYPINPNGRVALWRNWYYATVDGIHKNRWIKHSTKSKRCDLMSMNLPKMLVKEMCSYITSEMAVPEELLNVISEKDINILSENTFALGSSLILILNDTQSEYGKSIIIYPADMITQDKDRRGIEYFTATNPNTQRRVNVYDIYSNDGVYIQTEVDVWDTQTNKKLSSEQYNKRPYIFFTFDEDLQYPFGKSLYADAIPNLKSIDLKYTNFYREYVLGMPRVVTTKEALRVEEIPPTKDELASNPNAKPKFKQYLSEDDEVFTIINRPNGIEKQQDIPIKQIEFDIRYEAYINGINFDLAIAGKHAGYDNGFFSFNGTTTNAAKTATEVLSVKSDLYKNIVTYQKRLANLLADLALIFDITIEEVVTEDTVVEEDYDVVLTNGETAKQPVSKTETSGIDRYRRILEPDDITFGDSVIVDDNQKKQDGLNLFAQGVIDKYELLTKYYNYTPDDANAVLARVQSEVKENAFDMSTIFNQDPNV